LFKNIKPILQGKPLVIVLSKIDLVPFSSLNDKTKKDIEELAKTHNAYLI